MTDLHIILEQLSTFGKGLKRGFKKLLLDLFHGNGVGGQIRSAKIVYKNLQFDIVVKWPNFHFWVKWSQRGP